jgi:8-amino-7-oxononanoate synthase
MTSDRLLPYQRLLGGLEAQHQRRRLIGRKGADFSSNDYLGLSQSREVRQIAIDALARGVAIGSGGSRLLRGNDAEHEALEAEAAAFFGVESALYFPGGFTANAALFSTLPQRGDLVVHDSLIHASAHDGMRAGRAECVAFAHNDAQAADDAVRTWRNRGGAGRVWIGAESLYSMDGDRAPLADLMHIADRHDAFLVIDEAHATGALGPDGRGLAGDLEGRENVVTLHTCGKALGAQGGLLCGPTILRDVIVNFCRPFIFATAPSPLMAAVVRGVLALLRQQPQRRHRLGELVAFANRELEARCGMPPSGSHILPVILGSNERAMRTAAALQSRGFDIRGIRPPTVPEGTARLRIAITLHNDQSSVSAMLDALAEAMHRGPA